MKEPQRYFWLQACCSTLQNKCRGKSQAFFKRVKWHGDHTSYGYLLWWVSYSIWCECENHNCFVALMYEYRNDRFTILSWKRDCTRVLWIPSLGPALSWIINITHVRRGAIPFDLFRSINIIYIDILVCILTFWYIMPLTTTARRCSRHINTMKDSRKPHISHLHEHETGMV